MENFIGRSDGRGASAQHHSNNGAMQQPGLATHGSILPHRPSLLPKNSLGALLLDFRASLRAPNENHYGGQLNQTGGTLGLPRDSTNDLENVLMHLTSGDAHVLDQELEMVSRTLGTPTCSHTWPCTHQVIILIDVRVAGGTQSVRAPDRKSIIGTVNA